MLKLRKTKATIKRKFYNFEHKSSIFSNFLYSISCIRSLTILQTNFILQVLPGVQWPYCRLQGWTRQVRGHEEPCGHELVSFVSITKTQIHTRNWKRIYCKVTRNHLHFELEGQTKASLRETSSFRILLWKFELILQSMKLRYIPTLNSLE